MKFSKEALENFYRIAYKETVEIIKREKAEQAKLNEDKSEIDSDKQGGAN